MANWKLRSLTDERRRSFLRLCGVSAAAVGIERSRLLNFLADEGGYGLAEAMTKTYGRALLVPCPNGSFGWFTQLWGNPDVALKACQNAVVPNFGALGTTSAYLYTAQKGHQPPDGYLGTYVPGQGNAAPAVSGVKVWAGGDRPFFYGPHAPWFDHVAGVPKYPVSAFMSGKDETHTAFPASALALSGTATLQAALASLGAVNSSAAVPVIGIDPMRYGRAPGAPTVATVPSAAGLIDLFNSSASQFALATSVDQQIFYDYYKALLSLRPAASRSTVTPQLTVTKNAAKLIGLNFATKLMPTEADLDQFGVNEIVAANVSLADAAYLTPDQATHLAEFGRSLIVVAKAFALGLTKTAIVSLTGSSTNDETFTDPHDSFVSLSAMQRARTTTQHLGRFLDSFYGYLEAAPDPEDPSAKLDQSTVFVAYGDTPKDLRRASNWPDTTANASNWVYAMDPRGHLKNGWFGQVVAIPIQGVSAFGYDPKTGADALTMTSEQVSTFSSAAIVYAVANGDKNKAAEYGLSPNLVPGLINST